MNQNAIEKSINTKAIVEFHYNGHFRIVEPHVLGISKGTLQILGYQVGGSSSSGGIPEWRRFDLNGMERLVITANTFPGRRPFPSGRHSAWDRELKIVAP